MKAPDPLPAPWRNRRIAIVGAMAAILAGSGAAFTASAEAAAPPAPLEAAREALALTDARLELMDEVMASKWFSRAPIEDPAQETTVKDAAVAKALTLGVAAAGTRALFAAEIEAAKEVQLGWGSEWLYYGAPPEMAAPELGQVRAQLSEISERIVATLPRLVCLSKVPDARRRVVRAAASILGVPHLGAAGRTAIVDSLLGLQRAQPTP